jgi:hypothetical protein
VRNGCKRREAVAPGCVGEGRLIPGVAVTRLGSGEPSQGAPFRPLAVVIGQRSRVGKPRFIRAPSSGRRASKGDLSEPIPRSRRVAAQTRGPRTVLRATLITTALKNGAQFDDVQNAAGVVTQAPQSYMIAGRWNPTKAASPLRRIRRGFGSVWKW